MSAPNAPLETRPVFDCTAVCPYDNVPGIGRARAGQERKALSRLGNLFHYWFLNAKRLFHMLIGLAFMVLTLAGASLTFAEWEGYRKTPELGLVHFRCLGDSPYSWRSFAFTLL